MTLQKIAQQFVTAINAHDAERLADIDTLGGCASRDYF